MFSSSMASYQKPHPLYTDKAREARYTYTANQQARLKARKGRGSKAGKAF